jgi:hypothetical protein
MLQENSSNKRAGILYTIRKEMEMIIGAGIYKDVIESVKRKKNITKQELLGILDLLYSNVYQESKSTVLDVVELLGFSRDALETLN